MADNELLNQGKQIADQGRTWLSGASTSTLIITGIVLLVVFVTGIWKSILSLVFIAALGIIAYFAVVSWQKNRNDTAVESTPPVGGTTSHVAPPVVPEDTQRY